MIKLKVNLKPLSTMIAKYSDDSYFQKEGILKGNVMENYKIIMSQTHKLALLKKNNIISTTYNVKSGDL